MSTNPGKGKGKNNGNGKGNGKEKPTAAQKLKLREETTSYLYDGLGLNQLKEYKGLSAEKAEYYYANGQVLARKMHGLKGTLVPDREPGMANGGTYYYLTDALGSVTDLVDHQGNVAKQYRYDAFGGLFTGTVGPYNTVGLTGKSYDPKTGLMDYSARWYDPSVGRFTQADTYLGELGQPVTQHRYGFVHNNPVNLIDPTGRSVETPGDGTGGGGGDDGDDPDDDLDEEFYWTTEPGLWRRVWQRWESEPDVDSDPDTMTTQIDIRSFWTRQVRVLYKGLFDHWANPEEVELVYSQQIFHIRTNHGWQYVSTSEPTGSLVPDGPREEEEDPRPSPEAIRQESNRVIENATGQMPLTSEQVAVLDAIEANQGTPGLEVAGPDEVEICYDWVREDAANLHNLPTVCTWLKIGKIDLRQTVADNTMDLVDMAQPTAAGLANFGHGGSGYDKALARVQKDMAEEAADELSVAPSSQVTNAPEGTSGAKPDSPSPRVMTPDVDLEGRAAAIHGEVSPRTQKSTTVATAQVRNPDGTTTTLVASSEPSGLRPAQRAALQPGEQEVKGIGHAEQKIFDYAAENGLTVEFYAASRPICPNCAQAGQGAEAVPVSPLKNP